MSDPAPPCDIDAETAVLSAILLRNESLAEVMPIIGVEDFFSDCNARVFEAFCELDDADRPIDILTVRSWLADRGWLPRVGGAKYLAEVLDSVPSVPNVAEYAKRIRDKSRLRRLIAEARRIAAEAYGCLDDPQEFIDAAEQALFEISDNRNVGGPVLLGDLVRDAFTDLAEQLQVDSSKRATTGLHALDEVLVGTDAGDVTVIAARPGTGKTAIAINTMALHTARQGKAVAVFSLEMQRGRLVRRMVCCEARVDSKMLELGRSTPEDWRRLTTGAASLHELPIYVDDETGITLPTIRAKARRIAQMARKKGLKLGLVIIDYVQFVATEAKYKSREEGVAAISRGCKRLARSLDVPVVALAQLNREVEKRKKSKPKMSDLRESGAIEQDADSIVFLSIDEEQSDSTKPTIVLADVAKSRHRGTGEARIGFTKAYTRFDDLEEGYEPDGLY